MSDFMAAQVISALPELDRQLDVRESSYVSPITRDTYTQRPFASRFSTEPVSVPNKNYFGALALIPEGHRMSALDEIEYLLQLEAKLRAENKSPREALQDPVFARQIQGNPYRWTHSHVALRAPNGKIFRDYLEQHNGRPYVRADYVIGGKTVVEGVHIPSSQGGKVVEWNIPLRIPAVVSDGDEPEHTLHWYLDTGMNEVAVLLGGGWRGDGRWCLHLDADIGRSDSGSGASFRLFGGPLEEVPLPGIEYYIKDRESYERGVRDGIMQERKRLGKELADLSARLKQ